MSTERSRSGERYPPQDMYRAVSDNVACNPAYPINIEDWNHYSIEPDYEAFRRESSLGIYIHIPFCSNKCQFCEFPTFPRPPAEIENAYVDALLAEIALYADLIEPDGKTFYGIDIGGGTPTAFSTENIERIWRAATDSLVRGNISHDWLPSIETTALHAAEKFDELALIVQLGIPRVSMGVQSTDPNLLRSFKRPSPARTMYYKAVENARRAGFDCVNVDLMYGLSGQSLESFRKYVAFIAQELRPDLISVYETRLHRTPLKESSNQGRISAGQFYEAAYCDLLEAGYHADYGSSYFSLSASRSNCSSYLLNRHIQFKAYLGIGAKAQGRATHDISSNYFSNNGTDVWTYIRNVSGRRPIETFHRLPWQESVVRHFLYSLYFHGMVDLGSYEARTGVSLREHFAAELQFAVQHGLISTSDVSFRLTKKGFLNYRGVIALFYSAQAQQALLERISGYAPAHTKV